MFSNILYNRGLHRIALLTAIATFPLIFMGGLVTSKHAGLSVPDWPNSYGYNMFLFPPSQWVGGILYEHVHRLAGTVVGLLSIAMVFWACLTDRRPSVIWMSVAILAAVIVQGVLGGLRVVLVDLDLAIVHACIAQAFFCLTALMVLMASRWWTQDALSQANGLSDAQRAALPSLTRLAIVVTVLIYLQLVIGAIVRHYQAGLAIPGLLVYGRLLPPFSAEGLAQINSTRAAENLGPVTLWQIWSHFAHRIGVLVVAVAAIGLWVRAMRRYRTVPSLAGAAWLLIDLVAAQIILGVMTVLLQKPADIATSHVAVGALVLVTAFVLAARSQHLSSAAALSAIPTGPAPAQPKTTPSPVTT